MPVQHIFAEGMWWVDPGWMPTPTKDALSLPSPTGQRRKQYSKRFMSQELEEITHLLPLWAEQTQLGEFNNLLLSKSEQDNEK